MKIRCKCNQLAVWKYAPSDSGGGYPYFCEDCVSRGCSCNIDPDTDIEYRDEAGRLVPCCEYYYSETGYDNDKVLDDSDLYDTDFDEP
jgi:hypothetical protein